MFELIGVGCLLAAICYFIVASNMATQLESVMHQQFVAVYYLHATLAGVGSLMLFGGDALYGRLAGVVSQREALMRQKEMITTELGMIRRGEHGNSNEEAA